MIKIIRCFERKLDVLNGFYTKNFEVSPRSLHCFSGENYLLYINYSKNFSIWVNYKVILVIPLFT
jgi:hypothetical protein